MRATVLELKKRNGKVIDHYEKYNLNFRLCNDKFNRCVWWNTTGKLIAERALDGGY